MFPPTVTSVCSPLPSSGSYLSIVPHFHWYYGIVRLLQILPGSLRSPLTARLPPAGCFFAPVAGAPITRPGLVPCCWADLTRSCRRRHEGLPSSWRIPVKVCPGLGTPAASDGLAIAVARMLPSARLTASASATIKDFGADSPRPASSLSTLRTHQLPSEWQDSLLACQLRL
jgi:hypothetical protein